MHHMTLALNASPADFLAALPALNTSLSLTLTVPTEAAFRIVGMGEIKNGFVSLADIAVVYQFSMTFYGEDELLVSASEDAEFTVDGVPVPSSEILGRAGRKLEVRLQVARVPRDLPERLQQQAHAAGSKITTLRFVTPSAVPPTENTPHHVTL